MKLLDAKISIPELHQMAQATFGNLVKAVVDIQRRLIVVDAELHSDEEAFLLENGSRQQDLWGINFYPDFDRHSPEFIEFDSMINLRPSQNNKSRLVEDEEIKRAIISIVDEWIP